MFLPHTKLTAHNSSHIKLPVLRHGKPPFREDCEREVQESQGKQLTIQPLLEPGFRLFEIFPVWSPALSSESAPAYAVQGYFGPNLEPQLTNFLKYEMWSVAAREFNLDPDSLLAFSAN
jgi:hypothetical protein